MNKQDCAVCSNPVEYIVSMVLYIETAVNPRGLICRISHFDNPIIISAL